MLNAYANTVPQAYDQRTEAPEHVPGREFSMVPTDAEPFISEADMIQHYRTRGVDIMAMLSDNEGRAGVAITRRALEGRGEPVFGLIAYKPGDPSGDGSVKFDFSRELALLKDGPVITVSSLLGIDKDQAAIADGKIWLYGNGGDLPYTRPTKPPVIVIDPGTDVTHKTIWARERHPL